MGNYVTRLYSIPKERVVNIITKQHIWHMDVDSDGSLVLRDSKGRWRATLRDYPLPSYVERKGASVSVAGSMGTRATFTTGWATPSYFRDCLGDWEL